MRAQSIALVREPVRPASKAGVLARTSVRPFLLRRESAPPSAARTSFARIPIFAPEDQTSASSFTDAHFRLPIQRKLVIGAVKDPLESEADAMAERIMREQPVPAVLSSTCPAVRRKCACDGSGGSCEACQEEAKDKLLRKSSDLIIPTEASPIVHEVLRSPGQPLEAGTRSFMEARFGYNLSQVRIHSDSKAAKSAESVHALAYTSGKNVVFGAGQYAPHSREGQKLIAHELTHTVQQVKHGLCPLNFVDSKGDGMSRPEEQSENETVASTTIDNPQVSLPIRSALPQSSTPRLQRKVSSDLPEIRKLLKERGFLRSDITTEETHRVLVMLKGLSDEDLRDTVKVLENEDKGYIERFLTHIGEDDKLNELETLRRIKNARFWKVESKTGDASVTTEVVGSCSPDQFQQISQGGLKASEWLNSAIVKLDSIVAAPDASGTTDTYEALDALFHSRATDVVKHIRSRLNQIRQEMTGLKTLKTECHGVWDNECKDAGAYVDRERELIVFCNSFFNGDTTSRAETIVHEMAHTQVGGLFITDRAYSSDRALRLLSTAEALTNAESYGLLVQKLATGQKVVFTAPQDKRHDCPADWWDLLQKAVAAAQRWNRNLQVTLDILKPEALKPPSKWGDLLGGTSRREIERAKNAVDHLASKLRSPIDFECEPQGGGRCDKSATYWYFTGHFHICPSWKSQNDEAARVESLLRGLYGYIGDVDDQKLRDNYARLARENNVGWAAPSLENVLGSSKWSPNDIYISLTPQQPKASKYAFTESGIYHERLSQDLGTAKVVAPPAGHTMDNFRAKVTFGVDYSQQGRPLPFTPPRVTVAFHFLAPTEPISLTDSDPRPIYQGDGQTLRTKFPEEFGFSFRQSGALQMRFELDDPDANVQRIYDDTIQIVVV
jgi:hypothetical protein